EIAGHDGEPSLGEVPGQEIAGRVVPLAERGLASLARRKEGECGRQRPGAGLRRGARAHDLPGQVVGLGHEHHPAGRATRHISRSTATTSATWMRTVWHVTRSKRPSGKGSSSPRAWSTVAVVVGRRSSTSTASLTQASSGSTPTLSVRAGSTRVSARDQCPSPHPTSSNERVGPSPRRETTSWRKSSFYQW